MRTQQEDSIYVLRKITRELEAYVHSKDKMILDRAYLTSYWYPDLRLREVMRGVVIGQRTEASALDYISTELNFLLNSQSTSDIRKVTQ